MKIGKRCRFYPCDEMRSLISSPNKLDELIYFHGLLDLDNIRRHDLAHLNCDLCMMEYFSEEVEKNPLSRIYPDFDILQFGYTLCVTKSLYRFKRNNEPGCKGWWRRLWRHFR